MSLSTNPVIARILMDMGLFRSAIGRTIMAATLVDDLVGWGLFAVILAEFGPRATGQGQGAAILGMALVSIGGILLLGRFVLPRLMDWVQRRFGRAPFDSEESYLLPADGLIEVRHQCVKTTQVVGELGAALMQEKPWDLFMICFAATHRGGHQLWDLTNMKGKASAGQVRELRDALKEVYVACDAAIGKLLEQAGEDTTTFVFSLHGMGHVNTQSATYIVSSKSQYQRNDKCGATTDPWNNYWAEFQS